METWKSLKIIKALADESRLTIINSLLQKPQYVEELAERLNLAQSTVSFHLKKLEDAELVYKEKEQYYVVFYINKEMLEQKLMDIISVEDVKTDEHEKRIMKYKEKVIKTYFKRGTLVKLPTQYKKRWIVLEEFIKLFEPEKKYHEKEVDSKVGDLYSDYCTIRRMLIDEGIMQRSNGIYSLIPEKEIDKKKNMQNSYIEGLSKQKNNDTTEKEVVIKGKVKMDRQTELKKAYKQTQTPMGVYQIKNTQNGKLFIGSSMNLPGKINGHKFSLKYGGHINKDMQNDYNKYGERSFTFEVLDYLEPKNDPAINYKEELNLLEEMWLQKLQPYGEKGYNKEKKERK